MTHIDKNSLKHFGVCFILSLCGLYGVCGAMGAALTKEWYDKKSYGHWCWIDLLFDILGCTVGMATHLWIFQSWNY
jgi:uncharacterized protein YfiM (DUF2279 family)